MTETLAIPLDDVFCPCCQDDLGAAIRQLPHVVGAHVDLQHKVAHVTVHAGMTDAATLRRQIADCNFRNPVPLPPAQVSSHQSMHHAASKTAAHGGHEAMGHDMSDPRMAAAMEADMRRRFVVALVLSLPVVAYSSLGTLLLGGRELPSPIDRNWILLAFSTPVALWASSVFHVGVWRGVRSGVLNMSVLVSLGILVSYLFSVGLTFTVGGETFYEAAVMLATFLLFGHWMEMKARRGSSDAVRTLLALAPSEANVERDGRVQRLAVSEVRVGDVIVLQPGERVAVDVLMRSDPRDVLGAIRLSKATVRKMKQNLFWAAIYNVIAIPIAAGALYPAFGILLRPEVGALAMSASSITVVSNALLLRRTERALS